MHTLIDSDNDGVSDSEDLCEGHDDSADADGVPDGCDLPKNRNRRHSPCERSRERVQAILVTARWIEL